MDGAELANRFAYHPAKAPERGAQHDDIRAACGTLAALLNSAVPEGREKSLAMTHLEEVMMWANAAIARQPGE